MKRFVGRGGAITLSGGTDHTGGAGAGGGGGVGALAAGGGGGVGALAAGGGGAGVGADGALEKVDIIVVPHFPFSSAMRRLGQPSL
jgi:hypothetical protein